MGKTYVVERTKQHIEALIFAADHPISVEEIKSALEESLGAAFSEDFILDTVYDLQSFFAASDHAFDIIEIDNGFRFVTKPDFHQSINAFLKQSAGKKLSNAALETLAIVAYKQPIIKSEIESIRGVNCDYLMQKLLDRDLVEIVGREESPGRPLLYATTDRFMDHFGLKSLSDLPKLKDFKTPENAIGESTTSAQNN